MSDKLPWCQAVIDDISQRQQKMLDEFVDEIEKGKVMAKLADMLGHDPTDRRTPLGDKLIARTRYGKVETPHECNRFGCPEMSIIWIQAGHGRKRHLCREHLIAVVSDMASAEERTHISGLPELLTDMLKQAE